ncbi:MAG: SPASM domain-containing protein [Deltaproteobacteria bacterium]|nr:SPASM domain-containing protein [Deltaproteobacteria bacterium]
MIWSKYNYLFVSKKFGNLLFNSLSNSFAELDDETYHELLEIKKNTETYDFDTVPELYSQLLKKKIIIQEKDDDYNYLKYETSIQRFNNSFLALTIAPTRHCNFSCEYCYEQDRPSIYMTDKTEEALIDFIKAHTGINRLFIDWYGGEPLLAFDRIKSITNKILELDIEYQASIITNAYLLDKTIIEQLPDLKINEIQITLDGLEETHNKRRPHIENNDSYKTILHNIDDLVKFDKEGKILKNIRMNVDATNSHEYKELYKLLNEQHGQGKLMMHPGFVDDITGCRSSGGCLFDKNQVADFITDQYENHKIKDLGFYPPGHQGECMARSNNSYLVGPEGDLYKCWNDIGNDKYSIGNIHALDKIKNSMLRKYMIGADPLDDPRCNKCFYFPMCSGGCPWKRLRNKYDGLEFDLCTYFKVNLDTFLEIHYEIKKDKVNIGL